VKIVQIGISLVVIAFVTWIGDRQCHLAGLAAAMPLTIPLTMWIVFTNTGHDYQKTAEFAGGAITSILGTTVFVLVCYALLRARLHFGLVLAGGYAAWFAVIVLLPQLARQASRWAVLLHK
jgi:F0F1-type ATP synthase assembly protein I